MKIDTLKNLEIQDINKDNFQFLVQYIEDLAIFYNDSRNTNSQEFQDLKLYIEQNLESITGNDRVKICQLVKQIIHEMGFEGFIFSDQESNPNNNLNSLSGQVQQSFAQQIYQETPCFKMDQFEQNPLIFLQELIRDRTQKIPENLQQKIQDKYFAQMDQQIKRKINMLFVAIKSTENQIIDQQEQMEIKQKSVECLEILKNLVDQSEFLNVLYNYLQLVVPSLKIEMPLDENERIIKDFQEVRDMLPEISGNIFTVQDFMKLLNQQQIQLEIQEISQQFFDQNIIDGRKLMQLIFECIKSRNDFQQIIQIFSELRSEIKITKTILFLYAYNHADNQLKTLLFTSCSQYMAVPITVLNPWDFDIETQMPKRIFFPELIYAYEKKHSVFQFKISGGSIKKSVRNCTTIINKLFGKDFQLHQDSSINDGTIEIQFDYNCTKTIYLAVADSHGYLEEDLLKQISPLFDCLIIHADQLISENSKLKNFIEYLDKCANKIKQILIIVHKELDSFKMQSSRIFQKVIQIQIPFFQNFQENNKANFYNICYQSLKEFYQNDTKGYMNNTQQRINSRIQMANFMQSIGKIDVQKIIESLRIVQTLVNKVIQEEDLKSQSFLPMIHFAKLKTEFENKLVKDSELSFQQRAELKAQKVQNDKVMSQQKSTQIIKIFQEIIDRDIQLETLPILTQIIKGYLQSWKEPYETNQNLLRESIGKNIEIQDDNIKQQLDKIKKEIEKKTFSQEMILREIYYLAQYSSEKLKYDHLMKKLTKQLISNGQPIELIDGDTLRFISNTYDNLHQQEKEQLLVVSVIGVQSAGKSLLLNFLFGTQFHSSAGRCTKGVYASILTYLCPNSGRNKKILLLDTEGIQSPDARDPVFDRKIVYYIISISHVVLLCNKQEMNKDMGDILKLVANELLNSKQQNVHSPDIYIILNMLAQLDSKVQNECVNKLQDEFIEINENKDQESVNEIFKITIDNVIPLPFAFQRVNFGPNSNIDNSLINTVNIPQLDFIMLIKNLKERILSKFDDIDNGKSLKVFLNEWFRFAEYQWEYTKQLRNLEYFSTIQQKKEDLLIIGIINQLVQKYYEEQWNSKLKKYIDDHLQQTLESFQGGASIVFNEVQRLIQSKIDNKYEEISLQALAEYYKQCNDYKYQKQIVENRKRVLNKKKEHYIQKVKNYCANKVQIFIQEKSQDVGNSTLQQKIVHLLKEKHSYQELEAKEIFENEAWPEVLQKSQDVLSSKEEIISRIQNQVGHEFQQVICVKNEDNESFCNKTFNKNPNIYPLFQKFNDKIRNQKLIFFEGDKKPPNFNKLQEFQKKGKKYLNQFPKQFLVEKQSFEYYNWKKALNECVDISKLAKDIQSAVQDYYEYQTMNQFNQFCQNMKNSISINRNNQNQSQIFRFRHNYKKVNDIINQFKNELSFLGINITAYYSNFIPGIDCENYLRNQKNLNSLEIIGQHLKNLLNHKKIFKPFCYPYENPLQKRLYFDQNTEKNYRYLDFQKYKMNNYIQTSDFELNQEDLFFIRINKKVNFSKVMISKFDIKYKDILKQLIDFIYGLLKPIDIDYNDRLISAQYFQENLNWQLIFQEIEECIVKNYSNHKEKYEKLEKYIKDLQKNDNKSIKIMKKFHLFDSKCTREVIKGVRQIISSVNEELDCFCLQFSEEGISLIYLLAQTALSGLCSNLDLIEQGQPLRMLDEKKEIEKKLFVGRLTMNNSMVDQGLGVKLVNEYSQLCYNDNKVLVINQFKEQIHYVSEEFKNINQVKQLESFCIEVQKKKIINKKYKLSKDEQREIDEYVQLIFDPKKILSQKFEKKFEPVSSQLIQESLNNFKELFDQNLDDLLIFLMKFQIQLQEKKIEKINAALAFQLHAKSPQKTVNISDEELKKFQKIAMQRYFIQMVTQTWNSNSILKFNDEKIWLQKSPSIFLPIFTDFKFELDEKLQNFLQSILKEDDQICNISIFIQEAINAIKNIKSKSVINIEEDQLPINIEEEQKQINIEEDQIPQSSNPQDTELKQYLLNKQELLGECYQKLRQKYLGCQEYCPLCRKQCDVDHNEHEEFKDQRHECQTGHQMQSIGGAKHFKDNYALLQSCDEIKNKDNIKYDGNDINWENFKLTILPNWNMDSSNEVEVQKNREKNVMIWNLIGKDLCKIYNQNPSNIGIIFKEASNEPFSNIEISKIHYIIMLDDSGSMQGKPWNDLMNAFTIFLKKLLEDNNLRENSSITVINHNSKSIKYFQEQKPSLNLLNMIKYRGGGNDFDKPLFESHNICQQSHSNYDKILLYFMSDGGCKFPEQGIKRLLDEKKIIKKIEFHSIAFGSGADKQILKQMADSFPAGQGKMSDAPNAQALAQTFIDIVPNIYN